ncbi:MAG: hypothetical protein QM479_14930 [Pseudomonadota bacterium]
MKQRLKGYISQEKTHWLNQSVPWLAGASLALGHIVTTSNCTLPQQGRCSTCGSCIIALGALVSWAAIKNNKEKNLYQKK